MFFGDDQELRQELNVYLGWFHLEHFDKTLIEQIIQFFNQGMFAILFYDVQN